MYHSLKIRKTDGAKKTSTIQAGARTDVWDLDGQATPLHAATTAGTNAAKMVGSSHQRGNTNTVSQTIKLQLG